MDFGVRKFRSLLLVATCGMAAEFLLALADTVIAGNLVGEVALGGINLLQPIFNLVQFTAALIGTGAAIRYSLETGRFDRLRASEMFSQGFWSVTAFGFVLLALFVAGRETFLGFIGAAPDMTECARAYWKWYAPCTVLLPMTLYMIAMVYADGDMISCALGYASLIGGNIVASFFLCRHYGVAGCAMGTVLGNSMAVLSLFSHFLRRANTLRLRFHFNLADLRLICKSSFADASVSLCWSLLFFLLANLVVEEFGSRFLPVLSVVLVCINLTLLFNGVSAAAQPIVGIFAGERNARAISAVMRAAVRTAFIEGVIAAVFFACVPGAAVKLVGIGDPSLVPIAEKAVRIVAIGFLGAPFVFLFNSYYLFVERYALACWLTFIADIVVYAVFCLPAAHFFGMDGLWWSLGLAPAIAVIGFALFVRIRYGRDRFPLLLSASRQRNQYAFGFRVKEKGIRRAAEFAALVLEVRGKTLEEVKTAGAVVRSAMAAVLAANGQRVVHAEVSLDFTDGMKLILRDDGEIFDPTPAVSVWQGSHFVTMGYNRTVFELRHPVSA